MKNISQYRLILYTSIFLITFANISFYKNILNTYQFSGMNIVYIFSLSLVFLLFLITLFTLLSSKYTTKPILITTVFISSFSAYFMDSYNVVIDDEMIRNIFQTNVAESLDLFSLKLIFYVTLLGIVPSYLIFKSKVDLGSFKFELINKVKIITFGLLSIVVIIFTFSKFYTSFFREHKSLRYYTNPTYWIYSIFNYINKNINSGVVVVKTIGNDAKTVHKILQINQHKSELIILVVGEALRADKFSLNGYYRETNPLLKNEDIINFSNIYSCGTSTAISVPCMFSIYGKENFSYKKGVSTENVVDVLSHAHVNVLWRDNNSDSKGVALRVEYEDYKSPSKNPICDEECRDEGMLIGLDEYIKKHQNQDILIVLHQMGNHGPAYYKRYPKKFEKFTPVCKTNQLEECSVEEVNNAYDNAVLYTDYFLSKAINFLKKHSKEYETALIYMSDHGESLGENGIYLHGMPYLIAPESQKHVGSFVWFGDSIKDEIDVSKVALKKDMPFSQDNLFHTLLGLFEVSSEVYKKELDIFNDCRKDK